MNKPIAVLISDVHYNIQTLPLADAAMRQAISKANELNVSLVVAGDLHDTKANLRGECVNAMLETFSLCKTKCYILRGNHDSINEKSVEHSLNFLKHLTKIVDTGLWCPEIASWLLPYHHDAKELKITLDYLLGMKLGYPRRIIMHQGLKEANAGDYIQDKSALTYDDVKDFRVISGHYHTRQDIKTGRPQKGSVGLFSYIGNPYTLGFGEANDPPKGYQILMDDGTLEFVSTNLRKHVIFEASTSELRSGTVSEKITYKENDLLWVKITGTKEELLKYDKRTVAKALWLETDFRLDLIPTDTKTELLGNSEQLTQAEILDALIDSMTNTSDDRKARLKQLWRNSAST